VRGNAKHMSINSSEKKLVKKSYFHDCISMNFDEKKKRKKKAGSFNLF